MQICVRPNPFNYLNLCVIHVFIRVVSPNILIVKLEFVKFSSLVHMSPHIKNLFMTNKLAMYIRRMSNPHSRMLMTLLTLV